MKINFTKTITTTALAGLLFMISSLPVSAQSTFSQIVTIFQTKCAGSSCHTTGSPSSNAGVVILDTTESVAYFNLINKPAYNPAALASGYKLVLPYNPDSSFLFRKLNCNLILPTQTPLVIAEGDCMPEENSLTNPDTSLFLPIEEVKMIRGWILCGAPDTGIISPGCITGMFDNELPSSELKISPNPFTNSFKVNYTLEKAGHPKLVLLNILGEELTTLVSENQVPGNYQFDFDGSETKLPGVYIIRLSVDGKFASRKIVRVD